MPGILTSVIFVFDIEQKKYPDLSFVLALELYFVFEHPIAGNGTTEPPILASAGFALKEHFLASLSYTFGPFISRTVYCICG